MQRQQDLVLSTRGGQKMVFSPQSGTSYNLYGTDVDGVESSSGLGEIRQHPDEKAIGSVAILGPFVLSASGGDCSEYVDQWFCVSLADISALDCQDRQ